MHQPNFKAFTLVELVVASALLLLTTLSCILALAFSHRASALAALQLQAAHFMQGEMERIHGDDYDHIDATHYPDLTPTSSRRVFLDAEKRVPLTVNYDILSTLPVVSATASSVTVGGIPRNALRNGVFGVDELTSNTLVVAEGTGMTQRGWIRHNTANTISFTADMSGKTQTSWWTTPNSSSVVQLNMGKIVTIRTSWSLYGRRFTEEMRTLVVLPLDL